MKLSRVAQAPGQCGEIYPDPAAGIYDKVHESLYLFEDCTDHLIVRSFGPERVTSLLDGTFPRIDMLVELFAL